MAVTRTGIVAVVLLAGCASSTRSTDAGHARHWLEANALQLRLMHGHAANLELVLGDPAQVEQQAPQLTAAVAVAEARLPSPDKDLTRLVRAAAEDYGQGAVEASNPGGVATARGYLERGDREFQDAVDRSETLGRSIWA